MSGEIGNMCPGYSKKYGCGHQESIFGLCGCEYSNFCCQPNVAHTRRGTPTVLVEYTYDCRRCTWHDVRRLLAEEPAPVPVPINRDDSERRPMVGGRDRDMTGPVELEAPVANESGRDVELSELGAETRVLDTLGASGRGRLGSDTENQGNGTSVGVQRQQPSQKRQRSPETSFVLPQSKSLKRSQGSTDLKADALRQSSGGEGAKNEGESPKARGPNCGHVSDSAAHPPATRRKSLGEKASRETTHFQPVDNGPARLGPLNIRNIAAMPSPPRTQMRIRKPKTGSRAKPLDKMETVMEVDSPAPTIREASQRSDAEGLAADGPVGCGHGAKLSPDVSQIKIPTKIYLAVKPNDPLLSSPKPPLKD